MEPDAAITAAELLARWGDDPDDAERIVHVEHIPARRAMTLTLEPPLASELAARLTARGIERLYRHQARAITHVRAGRHTAVVAGTSSGKTLCYAAPIAETTLTDGTATALLLYPTKALAQDQLRALMELEVPGMVAATYDGDTDRDMRAWVRRHATVVLTNPDMLHVGIMPNHRRWAGFLGRLRHVVVDEMHMLRGIFGSHVAHVLRRLRRLAAHYGSEPTFVFCSATIGNPGELASRLTGLEVEVVDDDASPAGAKDFVLWNPPLTDDGRRASPLAEATSVFVDAVRGGHHAIAFARSRKGTELMYRWARERLEPELAERIAPYRAGYLPAERRRIEADLFSGKLRGVIATNALELGVDVGTLDVAVLSTYPGTIASLRQQAGRAGRTQDHSMAVLVAGEDNLDQYFMTHPRELFCREPEAAVVNPDNPEILAAQLGCAAYELPLVAGDHRFFGDEMEETAAGLARRGDLRLRGGGLYWGRQRSPAPQVSIRTSGADPYTIVDVDRGRSLGTLDEGRAFSQGHEGAIYLHQGESFLVRELDLERREVRVEPADAGYYTQARIEHWIDVERQEEERRLGRFGLGLGRVEVETHVTGYQRKELRSGTVLATEPLALPPQRYSTQAFWVEVPEAVLAAAATADVPGTLHAAEHAAIGMLPLFAICDRWDVGGLSTPAHPHTGGPVWFIYDGYPGGAGIAPIGYRRAAELLAATREAVASCPCESGCPSCVQSPKCGNFNEPLDKAGAVALIDAGLG